MRASDVKRWHIVATNRTQSVADHSYRVAVIAGELATEMGWMNVDKLQVMAMAIAHDQHEALYGDIPTPAKRQPLELPDNWHEKLVKVADIIECYTWFWFNKDQFNVHSSKVCIYLEDRVNEMMDQLSPQLHKVASEVIRTLKRDAGTIL